MASAKVSKKQERDMYTRKIYIIFRRNFRLVKEPADNGNVHQDILPDARDITKEESGKDSRRYAEGSRYRATVMLVS
jgi:hypothetical protein